MLNRLALSVTVLVAGLLTWLPAINGGHNGCC